MTKLTGSDNLNATLSERIVVFSISLFKQVGIRNVTTQEIAQKLNISKKTLYNQFPSKSDLIFKCVEFELNHSKCNIEDLTHSGLDAIEEMMYLAQRVVSMHKEFNDEFIYELEKFYPESWKLIKQYKNTYVRKVILENLEKGKKQGYYRKDLNERIVSSIYIGASNSLLDYDIFSRKDRLAEIFKEFFLYHIHAVATAEGGKRLEELKLKISL